MSKTCNIAHPLSRQGTSQLERFPAALDKNYVQLDERTLSDLVRQSAEYSKYLAYYGAENPNTPQNDWQVFFKEIYDFNTKKCLFKNIEALENGNTSPHLALFLAFLQLFKISQDKLNELGENHLKLFYEEVLQIQYKAAQADKAILFVEVAKTQESALLEKNVELIAGKDKLGNELLYKTTEDVVLNHASVTALKTIFVERNSNKAIKKIAITHQADTANGIAKPIETTPASWQTFGNNQQIPAEIGFAISSPIFHLSEGTRTIKLSAGVFSGDANNKLMVQYTSPKGWKDVSEFKIENGQLHITIKADLPAVVAFNPEKHTGKYESNFPILKITLNDQSYYNDLNKKDFAEIKIQVEVENMRTLQLYNDLGEIDAAKPFYPFGLRPAKNSSKLIIGSASIFNKYLTNFSLNPTWIPNEPQKSLSTANVYPLQNGLWSSATIPMLNNKYQANGLFKNDYSDAETELELTTQTKNNFIKLVFGDDYNYEKYLQEFSTYIAKTAAKDSSASYVSAPYIPEFESLSINYKAEVIIKKDIEADKDTQFYHIQPFGLEGFKQENPSSLLPVFLEEGTLCIGISNLKKGQNLSLHFLVQDGSGDVNLKPNGITWNYLRANKLQPFKPSEIIKDSTHQLKTSGIIRFAIPQDAFEGNSILPSEQVWLLATCKKESAAYPKTIAIRSQAIECTFLNQENDTEHLKTGLPANSISKLVLPNTSIKKIEQPQPSFGGRTTENKIAYYTRTSELLRHKHRAWSIWDYERIILEEFPSIYQVKCISHSNNSTEYAPRHVLIVVVPQLNQVQSQDKLAPKVSVSEREQIKEFIQKYTSTFVKIEVINPVYEALEINSHVTFLDGYEKAYYTEVLNQSLINYLAPWLKNQEKSLVFQGELYKSQLINFIEEQVYVHYVSLFEVKKHTPKGIITCKDHIKTTNESVVLTSYAVHHLDPNQPC